ncbi:MAG: acyloxyacyl hydrolase [Lysobacter sp.]|nr:acyloxyacyl hydrolase [Lysobacter sp.]
MKPSGTVALAASAALALALSTPARAGVHVGVGAADEHQGEGASTATIAWRGNRRHPLELMGGYIGKRDDNNVEESWFVAASKRLYWRQWFASGGLAWVNVDNDILSGHGQFITGIGRDFGPASLSIRHLSNASTAGRNRGETLLLLEYRFGR